MFFCDNFLPTIVSLAFFRTEAKGCSVGRVNAAHLPTHAPNRFARKPAELDWRIRACRRRAIPSRKFYPQAGAASNRAKLIVGDCLSRCVVTERQQGAVSASRKFHRSMRRSIFSRKEYIDAHARAWTRRDCEIGFGILTQGLGDYSAELACLRPGQSFG